MQSALRQCIELIAGHAHQRLVIATLDVDVGVRVEVIVDDCFHVPGHAERRHGPGDAVAEDLRDASLVRQMQIMAPEHLRELSDADA